MVANPLCVYDLPNEILISILKTFPTLALLRFTTVSRRFHSLILRILHFRLLLAASLSDYKLILEAYHPSRRYTDPYLFCTYLGTDGLSSKQEGEGSLYADCTDTTGHLAKLGALYSRFRPERPSVSGSMPLRRIAGASTPAPSATESTSQPIYGNDGDGGDRKVTHTINLDADELFTQFCAYSSLVRLGPRRGVFLSTVPIVETGQGVMRVWRTWLRDRAREQHQYNQYNQYNQTSPDLSSSPEYEPLHQTPTTTCPVIGQDKSILWLNSTRNVGLRVFVSSLDPRCYLSDEVDLDEQAMSFQVEIQELVIRTTHLMLAVETSMAEQQSRPGGRALIFGNFATAGPAANRDIMLGEG